ncbi:MAG TPA: archaellin/type IV pilin N-terminal domain-containing protein [Acidobacteriota bacterium]|nr:archaellin/type IV pilin N-terminal domain-containing protein [Acidobacteriota bacterium]
MMNNKKAEAGIGTLILFIALILVAAVAAGVLIQTSSSLQSKALATGSEAEGQVSTKVMILSAWAENATGDQLVDYIIFKAKLAPGSEPIILDSAYVSFDTEDQRRTYRFNDTGDCTIPTVGDDLNLNYSVSYAVEPRVGYTTPGYLLSGDVVDICIRAPVAVGESQIINLAFAPKVGTVTSFTTTTPDVMTDTKIQLYP